MKSVVFKPDTEPVQITYTDNDYSKTYEYKWVQAQVDGEQITKSVLLPLSEEALSPPPIVMQKIKEKDLSVQPKSKITLKEDTDISNCY